MRNNLHISHQRPRFYRWWGENEIIFLRKRGKGKGCRRGLIYGPEFPVAEKYVFRLALKCVSCFGISLGKELELLYYLANNEWSNRFINFFAFFCFVFVIGEVYLMEILVLLMIDEMTHLIVTETVLQLNVILVPQSLNLWDTIHVDLFISIVSYFIIELELLYYLLNNE